MLLGPGSLRRPALLAPLGLLALVGANVVRIAHLQPNDPTIMHEPHVLKMCAQDLKERNILPPEISFQ